MCYRAGYIPTAIRNMTAQTPATTCNGETADVNTDTPMVDSESDDEVFEDVLPEASATNDAPLDVHDISVDMDMIGSEAENFRQIDIPPTPPESSFAPSVHYTTPLPQPRKHPLPSGGQKEASLIFYLDRALDNVGKRTTNRHVKELLPGELPGYKSFAEVVKDLDPLVDIVWVSGTPTLQLPYLIGILVSTVNCLPMFPPLPRTTLDFLAKLDTAFANLLNGHDSETGELLSGFSDNRGISTTDKVRVKGVVERARSTVTRHLVGEEGEDAPEINRKADKPDKEDEGFVKFEGFENDDDSDDESAAHKRDEQGVAHVFEKTIMELGELLGGDTIGIVTDEEQDMRRQFEEEAAAMRERAGLQDQQGVKQWSSEKEAMEEQRQYMEDGRKEFDDEAKRSGEGHGFGAHGAT